ncbi:MAG: cephalosporin hydroxylase family protein [Candidatus Nitrospinota bacterium M3_3B_026]
MSMYTREEFEKMRLEMAGRMAADEGLRRKALDLVVEADRYNWIHQTNWMGEPVLQLPQDMFAMQEIIYKTRPTNIIEVGVAWAGSLLFYATLIKAWGGGKVIGVDVYIPDDLRERVYGKGEIAEPIHLINASSVEEETVARVRALTGPSVENMVILDSNHTHDHVLRELRLYAPLVGKGHYIVCGDTIVEDIPEQKHRPRPWGPGDNPKTALREFIKEDDRFVIDEYFDNKLLLSCSPNGYLKRVRD